MPARNRMIRIPPASRRMPIRNAIGAMALVTSRSGSSLLCLARASAPLTPGQAAQMAAAPSFVGSQACAQCHQTEAKLWRASQHAHAMDHATDKTVLGDFSDAGFDYNGVHSRFFRDGDKFMVETDGPRRKARGFRGQIHVRRRSSAAISDRISRRPYPGALDRVGHAAEGRWRPALVPSLSQSRRSGTMTYCIGPS